MDPMISELICSSLEPGENLHWAGKPDPFRAAQTKAGHALFGIAFLILFTMTPVPGYLVPASGNAQPLSGFLQRFLIIVPVALLAAYSIVVPFLAYWKARGTRYAVTDRRLIVAAAGLFRKSITVASYDTIETPVVIDHPTGLGDIVFPARYVDGDERQSPVAAFLGIRDARKVYQMVLQLSPGEEREQDRTIHDYLELLLQGKKVIEPEPDAPAQVESGRKTEPDRTERCNTP